MNKTILAATLAAIALPAGPALAHDRGWGNEYRYNDNGGDYRGQRYETDYREGYQDEDGRYRCRKSGGTTGLLVGGVAGALLGRTIDRSRDRAVGTILGAAGGALIGRAVERGGSRCR